MKPLTREWAKKGLGTVFSSNLRFNTCRFGPNLGTVIADIPGSWKDERLMTFIKRFITFTILLVVFFLILFATCLVGGGINGAVAGAHDPRHMAEIAAQAGADFVKQNSQGILLGSLAGALGLSFVLSFCGVLPWCRKS
jgi:hypothetical protein